MTKEDQIFSLIYNNRDDKEFISLVEDILSIAKKDIKEAKRCGAFWNGANIVMEHLISDSSMSPRTKNALRCWGVDFLNEIPFEWTETAISCMKWMWKRAIIELRLELEKYWETFKPN